MASDLNKVGFADVGPVPTGDMFVSYRKPSSSVSRFINITELLTSDDYVKIYKVYKSIQISVTVYASDKKALKKIKTIELQIYNHLEHLNEEQSKLKLIPSTILTCGIVPFVRSEIATQREEKLHHRHQAFLDSVKKLKESFAPKNSQWISDKIEPLLKLRLEDLEEELKRLKQNPRIARSFKKVERSCRHLENSTFKLSNSDLIALGHTLEVREALKETHFVINHAQGFEALLLNLTTKMLMKRFNPENFGDYESLRDDVFVNDLDRSVDWYRKKLNEQVGYKAYTYHDGDFPELISGDCYFESIKHLESALSFLVKNTNEAFKKSKMFEGLFATILLQYFNDQTVVKQFIEEIKKIEPVEGGTLYSICVPKEKFREMGYLSHPFGRPVSRKYSNEQIDSLQDGDLKAFPVSEDKKVYQVPQVRLLAHKLSPKEGVLSIPHTAISPEDLKRVENEIELIIQRALLGFRI